MSFLSKILQALYKFGDNFVTTGTKLRQEPRDIELLVLNNILHFDLLSLFQFRVPGG